MPEIFLPFKPLTPEQKDRRFASFVAKLTDAQELSISGYKNFDAYQFLFNLGASAFGTLLGYHSIALGLPTKMHYSGVYEARDRFGRLLHFSERLRQVSACTSSEFEKLNWQARIDTMEDLYRREVQVRNQLPGLKVKMGFSF